MTERHFQLFLHVKHHCSIWPQLDEAEDALPTLCLAYVVLDHLY